MDRRAIEAMDAELAARGYTFVPEADETSLPCTCDSLCVQMHRPRAEDEPLAELARVAVAAPDGPRVVCTGEELVRLCYWARDTRAAAPRAPTESMRGFLHADPGTLLDLPGNPIVAREVLVMDARGEKVHARWATEALAAAIAEMRACGRATPIDPAEAPGGDGRENE